jgi:hypothetical protein
MTKGPARMGKSQIPLAKRAKSAKDRMAFEKEFLPEAICFAAFALFARGGHLKQTALPYIPCARSPFLRLCRLAP